MHTWHLIGGSDGADYIIIYTAISEEVVSHYGEVQSKGVAGQLRNNGATPLYTRFVLELPRVAKSKLSIAPYLRDVRAVKT